MRNKVAKKLKMDVALALYVGEGVTEQDVKDDRKTVFASSDFKPVYRARKKNYNRTEQVVKLKPDNTPDEVIARMLNVRIRKQFFRKCELRERKRK